MLATWIVLAACAWCARCGPGPPPPASVSDSRQHRSFQFHFAHSLYNVTIPENSGPRTYAAQPPDEDPLGVWLPAADQGLRVRYRIRAGDKDKFFKAEDRTVGDFCFLSIRTRAGHADVLNRERRDTYRLEVRATLTYNAETTPTPAPLEADVVVTLTVTDVNDLGPLFYPTEYEAVVPEDAAVHSSVARVFAEDADLGLAGELYYSLTEPSDQFAVHPTTGIVSLTRPLAHVDRPEHRLTVVAQDRGSLLVRDSLPAAALASHTARARLMVRVRPVNLHAPRINVERLPELAENTAAGEIYAIVRVTDTDEGVHGEIANLDIVDGDPDGHFRVRPATRAGEYEVRVHALLDRERTPRGYNLTLRATDTGLPPRSAYYTLAVRLADVNDNAPVFGRELYEASVSESAPPGTPLVRLKVTDADAGRNARVYIEVVGGNEGGEFRVNADTGVLYTAVLLDAEVRARYTLTVSAVDQGRAGARRQSSAKVEVTVLDANDNDPVFDRDELLVDIDENLPSGALVARLTARDADSGENGYVSYSVANLRPVPFEVDHFSGAVRTTRLLDYETMRREYVLRVRASDWGAPYRRQAEMRVTVRLRDLNDNRPEFERIDCEGQLPRTLSPGAELITLSAIDLDAGSVVSYRVVAGNDDGCFALDAATGVLSLACELSDAGDDTRVLNVTATDGMHFADTASLVFHLVRAGVERNAALECRDTGVARHLTDAMAAADRSNVPPMPALEEFALTPSRYGENMHAPEFVDFPVEVKVNESAALGTTLVKLRARDRDLGYNGLLAYTISAGDPDSAFRIDPETGEITLIGYLDREREADYYLNVTVYDLGQPPRTASRLLPVTVLDVNDNAPVFEKSLASFRVTENALNGTAIFRVNATDRDDGEYARVVYSLQDAADREFCVERDTGVLRVCAPLDRERRALYELVVRATDGGGLYAEALVRVTVDDVNDNAPAFALSTWAARVREDVPVGTLVAVLEARDPDLGEGGRVRYALAETAAEDATFAVDAASGVLRTAAPLDFEERQVYGVTVRASDGGRPPLWSEAVVIVEVLDVDENAHAPQFLERVLVAAVRENSPPGTAVLVVNATDGDAPGRDSRLAYYLLAGSGLGRFTIDDAGEVRTMAPLDRETTSHHWLTVCAQDHGLAPRHACTQLYVDVLNENDMVPWPDRAAYETDLVEHCAGGTHVLNVHAHDADAAPYPEALTYRIVAGNPDGLFTIDELTGEICTTGRVLDREAAPEHALEVRVSDGTLACSARVTVRLLDINDHSPVFLEPLVELHLPVRAEEGSGASSGEPDVETDDSADWDSENEAEADVDAKDVWHVADEAEGALVATVTALDPDYGANGSVRYSLRARGTARDLFRVQKRSARLVAVHAPPLGARFMLHVRACDEGRPPRCAMARVTVRTVRAGGGRPPRLEPLAPLAVAELDAPGLLLAVVRAADPDSDPLYYDIVAGDPRREFHLGRHSGNLLLARRLLHERQSEYALNVSVSDGHHIVYATLAVTVINDVNEDGVRFARDHHRVAIEESARPGVALLALRAEGAGRLLYGLHAARSPASLALFRLHSLTGVLELAAPLDRETAALHELTVWVRDSAPRATRAFARVLVHVHDNDEHAPDWGPRRLATARLSHRAPPGALVAKLRATDLDDGENARIVYSLAGGDAGGLFFVHPSLGDVTLMGPLPATPREYTLQVRAANPPPGARAATLPLHVVLVEPDDAPPRFARVDWLAEVYENDSPGAALLTLEARSPSTVWFELEPGAATAAFRLNPAAGTLTTARSLDYERQNLYNLTVRATNMAGGWSRTCVLVHVLDRNEFPPRLKRAEYAGHVSEAAAPGTLVAAAESPAPLVLSTVDADSPANRRRAYEIVDRDAATRFAVDPVTGALSVVRPLDHEAVPLYRFTVKVLDTGSPRLYSDSAALVSVLVDDVNDCPPRFDRSSYNATLLLPTAPGVMVAVARAHDLDTHDEILLYDIIEGDESTVFAIDGSGAITVREAGRLAPRYRLRVRVSDGTHSATALLDVRVRDAPNSGLVFHKADYYGSVVENSTKVATVAVLSVLGASLDEHVVFRILNPSELFTIGSTSGAVRTTGRRFDREACDTYLLLVEARSEPPESADTDEPRVARTRLHLSVTDVNDNCPVFVERPYVAGVAGGAEAGAEVMRVRALDADAGDNGEVRYEMKRGHGELFRVERHTGRITLKQPLDARNQLYRLVVAAFDGGSPACGAEADVEVRVWGGGAAPWWERARIVLVVRENAAPGEALAPALAAHSPLNRQLVYTLLPAEPVDEAASTTLRLFELDFDTGVVRVAGALDYEAARTHTLLVRATDGVTGAHADAALVFQVEDANDCAPEFEQEEYHVRVSEGVALATVILCLRATDNDTGANAQLTYWLESEEDEPEGAEHFTIDAVSGKVRVARSLDRERRARHHLVVGVRDTGVPPRSTAAHIWLDLDDVNDSAPRMQRALVTARVWEAATRGYVVARVAAWDPDVDDANRLQYALADPDETRARAFHVEPDTGLITVGDARAFKILASASGVVSSQRSVSLNVSVSDGAHAVFARVKVALAPDNTAPPQFTHLLYEARALENQPPPLLLTTVKAHDPDWGEYGAITYSIPSAVLRETFAVDAATGAVTTKTPLDREWRSEWTVPVMASDGGGFLRHTTVRVRVADLNDNAPVFLHREYRASVHPERRHPFITVRAVDLDEGDNANVAYSIYEPEPEEAGEKNVAHGLFIVDQQSGSVSLARNASQYESRLLTTWVRATDGGGLHATAPLAVYVLATDERAPVLRLAHADFFLPESAPPGTLITDLGVPEEGVTLRLAEGLWPRDLFVVDTLGRLTLAGALDRETQPLHHIGVLAMPAADAAETAPATMAQVTLHVLDENEHAPAFHSQPYVVIVAENTPPHSSLLQVVAEDADAGSNGEVRYVLSENTGAPFALDVHSGWLTLTAPLDRERAAEHRLTVVATDGAPVAQRRAARTTVLVRLRDYDDCAPVFANDSYVATVSEDALPGTVVARLELRDADYDESPVDMYVTSGDPGCQFGVRATGEVFVARALDRELVPVYEIQLLATDGKFTAATRLTVTVVDVNDNAPHCVRHRYHVALPENAPAGTPVVDVEVRDADEPQHARSRFYITGDGADRFAVDKQSGHVTVGAALDRETRASYTLRVHAQDRERADWECSSELEITVDDVNDNTPRFMTARYGVTLPEDAEPGTLVAKVHAIDADAGVNRFVRYTFDETALDARDATTFRITPDGIVTLGTPLDRETRAAHRVRVVARDAGDPPRSATALLVLTVADVNDNPPRFEFAQYHVRVPELDAVGTEILHVSAVSADTGVNADVYYAIVGGDERDAFAIDRMTGVLSIVRPLDYEKTREYLLTVQAVDGGEPPLSDLATVNVTVVDCNDNAPAFAQTSYDAQVDENASLGHSVVQMIADDADVAANGKVVYSVERGNEDGRFAIDPDTGYVSVVAPLDRESRDLYELIVRADDRGVPTLHATAALRVRVTDANDNPPQFAQGNYTTVVREDSPLGYTVLRFTVTDADAPPNGAPFTFDFQAGNEMGAFRLDQDGRLETAARFNRRAKDRHVLRVRVFDNGTPPLYSDARVEVRVVERSQYPPAVTPLEVLVNSYLDEFPGGVVGRIYATDRDVYDTLTYSLAAPASAAALFVIDTADGTLRALPRLDVGEYRLNVTVSDGKFATAAAVRVTVQLVSDEMLTEAVVVRFREVADIDFVLAHRKGFVRAVRNALAARPTDVLLLAVQPSIEDEEESSRARRQVARDLDVVFAVRAPGGGFHAAETVRRRLNANLAELEQATRLVVEELVRGSCGGCLHGACAERVELRAEEVRTVATEVFSLVMAPARLSAACVCLHGYAGERCETAAMLPEVADVAHLSGDAYLLYRVDKGVINGRRLLDDELMLSLRFRTRRAYGTLAFAAGRLDYNILEIEDGSVQFRLSLGSGEGVIRVDVPVADGAWHELRLERRGASVRLAVDRHVAAGRAPPPNAVLDLRHDHLYLGARLERHAHALAPDQPTRGFVGCLADVILAGEPLPLGEAPATGVDVTPSRAQLVRRVRVRTAPSCPPLAAPTACASYPCLHGGTCREPGPGALLEAASGTVGGEAFRCECHARFAGRRCELDTDPCAAQPCLHGGECSLLPVSVVAPAGFVCACSAGLRGARCELGRWCGPPDGADVCAHSGQCEEGEWGPSCRCHGYYGPLCQYDVDECAGEPCLNGATCHNEPGSFRCLCPPDKTGMNCGNPLYSDAVVAGEAAGGLWEATVRWVRATSWPLWAGVAAALAVLLLTALLLTLCRRRRTRAPDPDVPPHKESLLNSAATPHDIKRTSKLSNLEAQRERRGAGNGGATGSSPHRAPLNNMDTLRSYGSAGDELELIPPDYLRNLNVPVAAAALTADKPWSEQMHLRTFTDNKIYNDLKGVGTSKRGTLPGLLDNRLRAAGRAPSPPTPDPHLLGGYHWDCSDWGTAALGAAISEVAGSERPDSSDPPSSSRVLRSDRSDTTTPTRGVRRRTRATRSSGGSSGDDDGFSGTDGDGRTRNVRHIYALHPDAYLPRADTDSDGVPAPPRLRRADAPSLITMLEERSSLLGDSDDVGAHGAGARGSCSTLSANVCDIEESDAEEEVRRPLTTDV